MKYKDTNVIRNEVQIGEVGKITNLTHVPQTVTLNSYYENPVVFVQSPSYAGSDPATVRVKDVQSNRFTIYVTEPSDGNGLHNAEETVSFFVLETGNYTLVNGAKLEVGTVETSATVGTQLANQWESILFNIPFETQPVVLSQIQTHSDSGLNYLQTRHQATSILNVELALEQEEAVTIPHPPETIGYLAITNSKGTWNGMAYEANAGEATADFSYMAYLNTFNEGPSLLTSLASYNGYDNSHLRFKDNTAYGVNVKVEEDTTFDSELGHAAEEVSYIAIDGQGMLTALDPQIPVGEVGTVTNLTHLPRVVELSNRYTNPIVLAQSVGWNGTDPVVVRVTGVQSDRFTMFLAEPSNLNGTHNTGETVSFVVLESGSHRLSNGTRLEVGSLETDVTVGKIVAAQWEDVSFSNSFEAAPAILTQVQTTNPGGRDYLQTRQLSASNTGFVVALEQDEIQSEQHPVPETIGYLAIEKSQGEWGDFSYEAAETPVAITNAWTDQSFEQVFEEPPALLSSLSTYFGSDNAHLRFDNLGTDGVQLTLEEDTTRDMETNHSAEVVSYLAIEGQGKLVVTRPQWDIGEVGRITNLTHTPQVITLLHEYNNPVVFTQSATIVGTDPVSIRIRNVESNQFEIYLTETSNLNQLHNTHETVTYMVLEAGTHQLNNGVRIEVGTVETEATVSPQLTSPSWETIPFSVEFSESPVLLSQIQTVATDGQPYLQIRHEFVSATAVSLALEQEEKSAQPHPVETVGYMAIEPGSGFWSGMIYEATTTENVVTHDWYEIEFGNLYTEEPAFLSSLASYYGYDNGHLRYSGLTPTEVQIKLMEDTTLDAEVNHYSAESVPILPSVNWGYFQRSYHRVRRT